MYLMRRIREALKDYLKNLAEENKKSFGSGRMDCCDINRKQNQRQHLINRDGR